MNLQFKQIDEQESGTITAMIEQDEGVRNFLLEELNLDVITVAYLEHELVGFVQIEAGADTSFVIIFVSLNYRNRGIGEALLNYAEELLREKQTRRIMTAYPSSNRNSKRFAEKFGYERNYSSTYMQHTAGKFPDDSITVRTYCDEDYPSAFKLYSEAFHDMRVSVGDFPESRVAEPSQKSREAWKRDEENRYTCLLDEEIVGHGHLDGHDLGSVSMRIDMQGKGIGKRFVKYLCNELYDRGHTKIFLWCVVGNKARYLYDSLGFEELYVTEFAGKKL